MLSEWFVSQNNFSEYITNTKQLLVSSIFLKPIVQIKIYIKKNMEEDVIEYKMPNFSKS